MKTLTMGYLTGLITLACLPLNSWAVTPGTGQGLCADYYNDPGFQNWAGSAVNTGPINYDWAANSPVAYLDPDYFSVVWQGQLEPLYSETTTIYFRNDDGGRVYLNNVLILDNLLPPHGVQEVSVALALSAGQKLPLRVEVYENAGLAVAELRWSSTSIAKQFIPATQLYCSYPGNPTPTATPTPWAPACLQSDGFDGPVLNSIWKDRQIGLGLSGSSVVAGSLSFTASGITTSDKSDGFRFIYQESGGDFDASVKVYFVGNSSAGSRAGLMARESLDPQSRYAAVYAANSGVFRWQTRTAAAALAGNFSGGSFNNNGLNPAWLRLKRRGNLFSAWTSPDGQAWAQLGSEENLTLPPNLLIGIAALSGSGGVLRAVKMDEFKGLGCGLVPLTLKIYDSAGNLVRSANAGYTASSLKGLHASSGLWDPGQGFLRLSSQSWTYNFDGKDSSGQYLPNGVYLASLESENGEKASAYVTVVRAPSKFRAFAFPNPAPKGSQELRIRWNPADQPVELLIFNQAGELHRSLGTVHGGTALWDLRNAGSGVYLVALKIPGESRPKFVKIAVAR